MAIDPNSLNTAPEQPISPEEDATLQAIEALEVKSVELDTPTPKPTLAPVATPRTAIQSVPTRRVVEPIIHKTPPTPSTTPPTPVVPPVRITPTTPIATPVTHPNISRTADVVVKNHPTKPSEAIAEELANTPAPVSAFHPFLNQKSSKKPLLIALAIIIVIALAIGGYFGYQALQGKQTKPAQTTTTTPQTAPTAPAQTTAPTGDTESSVSSTVTDMQSQLNSIDDSDYDDSTISDSTLYN